MPRTIAMLARVAPFLAAACVVQSAAPAGRPIIRHERLRPDEQAAAEPADDTALLGLSEEGDVDEGISEGQGVGSDDDKDPATKSKETKKKKSAKPAENQKANQATTSKGTKKKSSAKPAKNQKADKASKDKKKSDKGKGKTTGQTGQSGQATGNPSATMVGSTGNSRTYDLTFVNPGPVNMNAIPAAYRNDVRSPDITGPGTQETARLWADAQKAGQTVFGLFYGAKYSDCARSVRVRTFWSNKVIDLSKPGCTDGTILNEAENYGRFQGSMKFCMHASGAPVITMYEKPGCPESSKWSRSLAITAPQFQGILDKYCIQVWAGGYFNAQLVNYQKSTGSMASC